MKLTVIIACLLFDICLANYSLFISETKLHLYFSNSNKAQLVESQFVSIVDNGTVLIEENGTLILTEVTGIDGGSGSGHFLSPDPDIPPTFQVLPPLPADVERVDFTWFSYVTVNYTISATQQGDQLFNPSFNVSTTGVIPPSPSTLTLRMYCRPFAMEMGRVLINLTTSVNHTENSIHLFVEKSCADANVPSVSTVYMDLSLIPELPVSTSVISSFHPVFVSESPHVSSAPPYLLLTSYSSSSMTIHSSSFSLISSPENLVLTQISPTPSSAILSLTVSPFHSSLYDIQSTDPLSPYSPIISPKTTSFEQMSLVTISVLSSQIITPSFSELFEIQSTASSSTSAVSSSSFTHSVSLSVTAEFVRNSSALLVPSTTVSSSVVALVPSVLPTTSYKIRIMSSPLVSSAESEHLKTYATSMDPSSSVLLETTSESSSSQLLVLVCAPIVGILLVSILISCCIIFCIKLKSNSKKAKHAFSDDPLDVVHTVPYNISPVNDFTKKAQPPLSLWMSLAWGAIYTLPRSLQNLITQLGVDRKSLSIGEVIARGEYGSVVSGQLNIVRTDVMSGSQSVTIKILTGIPDGSKRDEVVKFLEAATLMRGVQHENILPVLRVSVEDNYVPLVMYPMVEHGDMFNIIKLASDQEQSILSPLTLVVALELAIQIATAMNYLADHSIVHPDLALRNCVYDSGNVVKVSDGALAQQLHPECYYTLFGATRPVRWAAVETLQEGLCTVKSNVWSYGVTVWEILTYAEMPYSEVNNNRSILSTIKMGARLNKPDACPQKLYDILCACWSERGEDRPHFKTIIVLLRQLLRQLSSESSTDRKSSNLAQSRLSSSSMGKSVSRERLSYGDSPGRSRNRLTPREMSMSSLRRVSMASMMSRESTGEKLSVTFSVISGDDRSGSESDDDTNGMKLHSLTDQRELKTILREVSTSFIDASPVVRDIPPVVLSREEQETKNQSGDRSLVTLVLPSPISSPKVVVEADESSLASSNPLSLTPPPNASVDTQSKSSTIDLESVSTATYTSSPLHSATFLYPTASTSGSGVTSHSERAEQSPLTVHHRAYSSSQPPALLHSPPTAKSTDSGIRSDDESEPTLSPITLLSKTADSSNEKTTVNAFSNSLMAAFDSWETT